MYERSLDTINQASLMVHRAGLFVLLKVERVMGSSKETICGELLYELMVYEKINFKIRGRWKTREKEILFEDLEIMERLVQLIELKNNVMVGEIKDIVQCLKKKGIGNSFQRKNMDIMEYCNKANKEIDLEIFHLIEMAKKIICESQKTRGLQKIIFDKRKKKQMWLILMSLHNLPRIYLDGDGEFDNLKEMLILPNDALQYSNLYLMKLARNNAGSV